MNIPDIFYAVTMVYMVISIAFMIFVVGVVIKVVMALQASKRQLEMHLARINVARFSLQSIFLKNVLSFLQKSFKGGDRE